MDDRYVYMKNLHDLVSLILYNKGTPPRLQELKLSLTMDIILLFYLELYLELIGVNCLVVGHQTMD